VTAGRTKSYATRSARPTALSSDINDQRLSASEASSSPAPIVNDSPSKAVFHTDDATARAIDSPSFADKYGINMPIAREVDAVINHGAIVEQAYRGLSAETPGHEVHGAGF